VVFRPIRAPDAPVHFPPAFIADCFIAKAAIGNPGNGCTACPWCARDLATKTKYFMTSTGLFPFCIQLFNERFQFTAMDQVRAGMGNTLQTILPYPAPDSGYIIAKQISDLLNGIAVVSLYQATIVLLAQGSYLLD